MVLASELDNGDIVSEPVVFDVGSCLPALLFSASLQYTVVLLCVETESETVLFIR